MNFQGWHPHDGLLRQKDLFGQGSDRQLDLVSPCFSGRVLPDVHSSLGRVGQRCEPQLGRSATGFEQFGYRLVLDQRLELGVFENGSDHHLLADDRLLFIDQEHPAIGVSEQPTLACPPNQFGVVGIKVLLTDFAHPPKLSASLEDNPTAAIKLGGQVDRRGAIDEGGRIREGKQNARRRLGFVASIEAKDSAKAFPSFTAILDRRSYLQKVGGQGIGSDGKRPSGFGFKTTDRDQAGASCVHDHRDHASQDFGIAVAVAVVAGPFGSRDRTCHDDQATGLLGHPSLQNFDLLRSQFGPIGIEGDDRIVLGHLGKGLGELRQKLLGLLRYSRSTRLQEDVRLNRRFAKQKISHELIFAGRAASEDQDGRIGFHHANLAFELIVGCIRVAGRGKDLQLVDPRSDFPRGHLEGQARDRIVPFEGQRTFLLDRRSDVRAPPRAASQLHWDLSAEHPGGLDKPCDPKAIARKDPFGGFHVEDLDVRWIFIGPQTYRMNPDFLPGR